MFFRKKAIGAQPVLDTKHCPTKDEAYQLLEQINNSRAVIKEKPVKGVFRSLIIAFFILLSVASILNFVEKSIDSKKLIRIEKVPIENQLVDENHNKNQLKYNYTAVRIEDFY